MREEEKTRTGQELKKPSGGPDLIAAMCFISLTFAGIAMFEMDRERVLIPSEWIRFLVGLIVMPILVKLGFHFTDRFRGGLIVCFLGVVVALGIGYIWVAPIELRLALGAFSLGGSNIHRFIRGHLRSSQPGSASRQH